MLAIRQENTGRKRAAFTCHSEINLASFRPQEITDEDFTSKEKMNASLPHDLRIKFIETRRWQILRIADDFINIKK